MTQPISVLFLCLGNICRSPLAEGLFRHHAERAGVLDQLTIDSAGTSAYHAGDPPDPGSIRVALHNDIDIADQRSRPLVPADFEQFDFVICMDRKNLRSVAQHMPSERGFLIREFDDKATRGLDVPDPYGQRHSGFEKVFEMLDRCMPTLLEYVLDKGPRT